jgi:carboxyl-terminal processing protease
VSPVRTFVVALACALALVAAGLWLGGHPEDLPQPFRDVFVENDHALRAELLDDIRDNFYKEVDTDRLEEASLKGMVRALRDRFSHYFTPKETKLFRESVSGEFSGVGMTVHEHKRGLRVVSVFKGSPAERAGIHKDDVITAVNGESIAGKPTDIATAKIKGKPGTSVRLSVLNPATHRTRIVRVRRARIEIPVAQGRLVKRDGAKLGVVRLATFTAGAHGVLRQELDKVIGKGARGIVLDLRGNGGGLLREAVLVASVFIEDGPIVSTKGRTKPTRRFEAEGDAIRARLPVVVLVDRGSASASEIVTGALRDRGRATVVGERTFGKGVFQEIEPLSNGGALDLTVGSYYLPNGKGITEKGIRPQVAARDRPRTSRDEALPIALEALRAKIK